MEYLRPLSFVVALMYLKPQEGQTTSEGTFFEEDITKRDKVFDAPLFDTTSPSLSTCVAKCVHTHSCTAICHRHTDGSCSGYAIPVTSVSSPGQRFWKMKSVEEELSPGGPCLTEGQFFENKDSKNKYFRCISGVLIDKTCAAGLEFDITILTCRWP